MNFEHVPSNIFRVGTSFYSYEWYHMETNMVYSYEWCSYICLKWLVMELQSRVWSAETLDLGISLAQTGVGMEGLDERSSQEIQRELQELQDRIDILMVQIFIYCITCFEKPDFTKYI